jgi:hypothetical protein
MICIPARNGRRVPLRPRGISRCARPFVPAGRVVRQTPECCGIGSRISIDEQRGDRCVFRQFGCRYAVDDNRQSAERRLHHGFGHLAIGAVHEDGVEFGETFAKAAVLLRCDECRPRRQTQFASEIPCPPEPRPIAEQCKLDTRSIPERPDDRARIPPGNMPADPNRPKRPAFALCNLWPCGHTDDVGRQHGSRPERIGQGFHNRGIDRHDAVGIAQGPFDSRSDCATPDPISTLRETALDVRITRPVQADRVGSTHFRGQDRRGDRAEPVTIGPDDIGRRSNGVAKAGAKPARKPAGSKTRSRGEQCLPVNAGTHKLDRRIAAQPRQRFRAWRVGQQGNDGDLPEGVRGVEIPVENFALGLPIRYPVFKNDQEVHSRHLFANGTGTGPTGAHKWHFAARSDKRFARTDTCQTCGTTVTRTPGRTRMHIAHPPLRDHPGRKYAV